MKQKYLFNLKPVETEAADGYVTGAEVRRNLWPDQASHSIFLEAQGNDPDQLVRDGDVFSLTSGVLRFYSVPPCGGA